MKLLILTLSFSALASKKLVTWTTWTSDDNDIAVTTVDGMVATTVATNRDMCSDILWEKINNGRDIENGTPVDLNELGRVLKLVNSLKIAKLTRCRPSLQARVNKNFCFCYHKSVFKFQFSPFRIGLSVYTFSAPIRTRFS